MCHVFYKDYANARIPSELSAKITAKSYWKKELEDELEDLKVRDHIGSEEDAMEFAENKCSEQLYSHNCSKNCQDKGLFEITGLIHCSFIKHCNMLPVLVKLSSIPHLTFQFCFVQLTHTVRKFLHLPNARA